MPFTDNSDFIQDNLPGWLQALSPGHWARLGRAQLSEQYSRGQPPAWFTGAAPASVARLLACQAERKRLRQQLGAALAGFKGVVEFATPLLEDALFKRFGLKLDVLRNDFVDIRVDSQLFGSLLRRRPLKRNLLQAALHNFSDGQVFHAFSALAPAGAFHIELQPGPRPASPPSFKFRYSDKLAVAPADFARLCRSLDLGGQYQQHLEQMFVASARAGDVPALMRRALVAELDVAAQVAWMKGDLNADGLEMAGALVAGQAAHLGGKPVQVSRLSILGSPLNDVLIMSPSRASSNRTEPCVAWVLDDPVAPLKSYASMGEFMAELKPRLLDPLYQRAFCGRVPRDERALFQRKLVARLEKKTWNGSYYVVSDDLRANLEAQETPVHGDVFGHLAAMHRVWQRADAAELAISTATVDAQDRLERWEGYLETAQTLLNDAALFIPALAPVMAVVFAEQLMSQFFSGIEAWEDGLRDEAFRHLGSVVANVAAMLALGAAGAKLAAPAVIEDMRIGEFPGGQRKLFAWRQPAESALHWDQPQLLQRLGPVAHGLNETQVEQALAASGVRAADLRLMYHEGQPVPAMLAQSLERFRAVEEGRWPLPPRAAGPDTQALRRDYPSLPEPLAQELVAAATAAEQERLWAGVVPLRVAEEARASLQQLRISQAIEGLYVPRLANADTHRLLERLAPKLPAGAATGEPGRRLAIARLAAQDRAMAQEALGMVPIRPGFKPPLRVGREVGYPASGKGAGQGPQARIRRLYPALEDEQVRSMQAELEARGPSLHAALAAREAQWDELCADLDKWVARSTDARLNASRRQVGELVRAAWRRQGGLARGRDGSLLGSVLQLNGMELQGFPPISCELDAVAVLSLRQCSLEQAPESLLLACTRLQHLDLSGNRLTALPENLPVFPGLTRLQLSSNEIVLTERSIGSLSSMNTLRALMLDGNPLGRAPDVSQMHDLRVLRLRGTGIDAWPEGFESLEGLDELDLRQNHIVEIPHTVLQPTGEHAGNVHRINRLTPLHGNPLSASSRERLAAYYQEHGVHPSMLPGEAIAPVTAADAGAVRWQQGLSQAERASNLAVWQALYAQPGSADFFALLQRLSTTHDFQHAYASLRGRIWKLLAAAVEHTALREELFELAANPTQCGDGAALVFSRLVVREMVFAASHDGSAGQVQSALLELGKGLFRLDEVERIAMQDIAARPAEGLDEVEVRMAYVQGLADRLGLPGQPKGMIFRLMSGVTPQRLDAAALAVAALEDGDAMASSLVGRDFWVRSLEQSHAERFAEVDRRYQLRSEVLFSDRQHLTQASYLARYNNLMVQRELERQGLVREMTRQVLEQQEEVTEL